MENKKLTENQVIEFLECWYLQRGWTVLEKSINRERGKDLFLLKKERKIIIEAKGARGNPLSPTTTREKFSSGQIVTHLGKAILKLIDEKIKNPEAEIILALPDDYDIRKVVEKYIPKLKRLEISFAWVKSKEKIEFV